MLKWKLLSQNIIFYWKDFASDVFLILYVQSLEFKLSSKSFFSFFLLLSNEHWLCCSQRAPLKALLLSGTQMMQGGISKLFIYVYLIQFAKA